MKAVIDRVEGELAVLLLGDGQEQRLVPRTSLPPDAKEGSWLQIEMSPSGDRILNAVVDEQETARAGERIAERQQRLIGVASAHKSPAESLCRVVRVRWPRCFRRRPRA